MPSTILCFYRDVYSSQIKMSIKIPECFCHGDMVYGQYKLAGQVRTYHLLLTPASTLGYSQLVVMGTVTTITKLRMVLEYHWSSVGPSSGFIKEHLLKLWVTTMWLNVGVMTIWGREKGSKKLIQNQNCHYPEVLQAAPPDFVDSPTAVLVLSI